jgi:hypothetical protein
MNDGDELNEKLNLPQEEEMIIEAEKNKLRIVIETEKVVDKNEKEGCVL